MQPGKCSEGEWTHINEGSDCDSKNEDVPEEVMLAKTFTLKGLSEMVYDIKVQRIAC